MNTRQATIADRNILIQLRLDFLQAERGQLTDAEETSAREQMAAYFTRHLGTDFVAFLADIDGRAVSTVFLVITERPASPMFATGRIGTLLNVFTYPEYRRQGISTDLLQQAIREARRLGVSSIELSATPDGKPVYEKLGFTEAKYPHMRLPL